eukprot:8467080-Ditylum_brightwellii.AAC.1
MNSQPAGAVRHLWSNSTKPAPVSSTTPTTELPAKLAASKPKMKIVKKSAKPAPTTTAMVIYEDAFDDISDTNLLLYDPVMDKKEKIELDLVPQACGFSTSNHSNLKCDVEYDTPPTAQRSVK